jgi:phytoene dehydrogenase-like protein
VTELIGQFAPYLPASVITRRVITPVDLEQTFGITEGNIFHGDISMQQMFFMRPLTEWAQYSTPIENLYLCGSSTDPGGGVTGAPSTTQRTRSCGPLKGIQKSRLRFPLV